MRPRWTVPSMIFILVACGSAYADKVTVDWDRQANFGQYKTYAWTESKNPAQDQLMAMRIIQAVDGQLKARGLQKVEIGEKPDLSVAYDSGVSQKVSWVPNWWGPGCGWGPGWGPGWGWGPGCCGGPGWAGDWGWNGWGGPSGFYPVVRDIGSLAVNLVDQNRNQLVWRGVGSDTLRDDPQRNARKISELVAKMFRKYPPPGSCCRGTSRSMSPAGLEDPQPPGSLAGLEKGFTVYQVYSSLEHNEVWGFGSSGKTPADSTVKSP